MTAVDAPDPAVSADADSLQAVRVQAVWVHATCVLLGEAGVMIRGASGSGKTSLAFALVEGEERSGRFARFVGDDRVRLTLAGGRLIARAHPAIAGLAERRGLGPGLVPFEAAAVLRLVVDCTAGEPMTRLPTDEAGRVTIEGVELMRLALEADDRRAAALVRAALAR